MTDGVGLLKQQAEQAGVIGREMLKEDLALMLVLKAWEAEEAHLARVHSRLISADVNFASTPGEDLSGKFWTNLQISA